MGSCALTLTVRYADGRRTGRQMKRAFDGDLHSHLQFLAARLAFEVGFWGRYRLPRHTGGQKGGARLPALHVGSHSDSDAFDEPQWIYKPVWKGNGLNCMATISMEHVVHMMSNGSAVEVGMKLGLAASLSYHALCQFPRQAEVSTCLLTVAFINVLFFGILKSTGPTISNLFVGTAVFNLTLVKPS
jgi:hypothetical protein